MTHSTLRRHTQRDLAAVLDDVVALYRQVYADRLHEPLFDADNFAARVVFNSACPGWEALTAHHDGALVGWVYAFPLHDDWLWRGVEPLPPAEFTAEDGTRTIAPMDLMVLAAHRGNGLARRLHEELLAGKEHRRIVATVEQGRPRLLAHYRRWGYHVIGSKRPRATGSPLVDVIVRDR